MNIQFQSIGTIHTPYLPNFPVPPQPNPYAPGEFWIALNPRFQDALIKLKTYRYIYVLYYLDQVKSEVTLQVNPPWVPEMEIGLFASRSPNRPNPIGLSIVELKGIEGNEILISGIDVFNGTPLLDIKPYIKTLDVKPEANDGWYEELPDKDHTLAHLLSLPHDHSQGHSHNESQIHSHSHSHAHSHAHFHKHSSIRTLSKSKRIVKLWKS
jgi:tRNA (adenine37-N6)-methyltransferase